MAAVAHDLRNPIAVVRASAQMAVRQLQRGDAGAAERRLQAIVDQADRLTDLLERFLDAARAGSGVLPLEHEPVDLASLVRSATEGARSAVGEAASRPIQVDVPVDVVGYWDRARVERAAQALLANAYLYGAPASPVDVRARVVGRRVVLTVSGGGPGPAAEEAHLLFQPFFRGRAAAAAGRAGSGLGLYTARGIARAHGGDVRRAAGPADAFELELPLG